MKGDERADVDLVSWTYYVPVAHVGYTTPFAVLIAVHTFFSLPELGDGIEEPFGALDNPRPLDALFRRSNGVW